MRCVGLFLMVLVSCVALRPADALIPLDYSCCTEVAPRVSVVFLELMVHSCHVQKADEHCKVDAIILYYGRERHCVSPQDYFLQRWMRVQATTEKGMRAGCALEETRGRSARSAPGEPAAGGPAAGGPMAS